MFNEYLNVIPEQLHMLVELGFSVFIHPGTTELHHT